MPSGPVPFALVKCQHCKMMLSSRGGADCHQLWVHEIYSFLILYMIITCFDAHNLEQQSRDACCVATLPPLIRDPFDDARARTSWRWAPELANTCPIKQKIGVFILFVFQECDVPANVGVVIHLVKEHEAPKSAIKSRSEPSTTLSNPRKLQVATFPLSFVNCQ